MDANILSFLRGEMGPMTIEAMAFKMKRKIVEVEFIFANLARKEIIFQESPKKWLPAKILMEVKIPSTKKDAVLAQINGNGLPREREWRDLWCGLTYEQKFSYTLSAMLNASPLQLKLLKQRIRNERE